MRPCITGKRGAILLCAALSLAAAPGSDPAAGQEEGDNRFWAGAERVEVAAGNARRGPSA